MTYENVIEDAYILYKKILESGFDPRRKFGRDNKFYLKLKKEINCPINKGMDSFLKLRKVSAAEFITAFFRVSEPFSEMYKYIYKTMHKHHTSQGSESIKIKFEDSIGKECEIDFSDFEDFSKTYATLYQIIRIRNWSRDDFRCLHEFFNKLRINLPEEIEFRHVLNESFMIIPPVHSGIERLDNALEIVYSLFDETAKAIKEVNKPLSDFDTDMSLDEFGCSFKRIYHPGFILSDPTFTFEIFPSLVAHYNSLMGQIIKVELTELLVEEALDYFEELLKKVSTITKDNNVMIEIFEKVLNLPFWKYRWYVYEIWTTCIVIGSLDGYNLKLCAGTDGVLPLIRGKESKVAKFKDDKSEEFTILAQARTTILGIPGRKEIMPDLRIVKYPYKEPQNTYLIIECKQRRSMQVSDLQRNIFLYEHGAPKSLKNIFVNYDIFPKLSAKFKRTEVISEFQPRNITGVKKFENSIKNLLISNKIMPPQGKKINVVLMDVSGSMSGHYSDGRILFDLEKLKNQNPDMKLFCFNNDLCSELSVGKDLLNNINKNIRGGTDLEKALRMLHIKNPEYRKVLVLTDGGFSEVPEDLSNIFELFQCWPNQIFSLKEIWV